MTFSEILIIYFSLGAPVAVYYFQRQRQFANKIAALESFRAFVLWPAALFRIIAAETKMAAKDESDEAAACDRTAALLRKIFEIAMRDFSRCGRERDLTQFRETIERYCALSNTVEEKAFGDASEFYAAAGHPNPELAAVCRRRRSFRKIDTHYRAASREISQFFVNAYCSIELKRAVAELFETLSASTHSKEMLQMLKARTIRHAPAATENRAKTARAA